MMRKIFLLTVMLILALSFAPISSESAPLPVTKVTFDNGLTVLARENHANDIIALEIFLKIGPRIELKNETGISDFTQGMLLKGTENRTATQIANDIESIGGVLSTQTAPDWGEIYLITISEYFPAGLEILIDVIQNSNFPAEEIEKERQDILAQLKARLDSPFTPVYDLFRETLYGAYPYSRVEMGTDQTIKYLSRDDLVDFYKSYCIPNNMIVSVVGNFSTTKMLDMLEKTLGKLPEKSLPARVRLNQLADQRRIWDIKLEETKEVSKERELQAAWMIIGYPAPSVDSDDYPILKLINTILGGGMSSRFFVELRDKRGLAYDTSSFFPSRKGPSHFVGYIITSPESVEQAKEGMLEEIERLKTKLVSDEELEKAKKYLIGSFALAHQRNKDQAWYLGWYETMGAGYEFDAKYPEQIEAVTKEDIMEIANKYFTEAHIVSILMPTEK